MTKKSARRATALWALLASTALAAPALAQSAPPPKFVQTDSNGVDPTTGLVSFEMDEGGIGSGEGAIRMKRFWAQNAGWADNWSGGLYRDTIGGVQKLYVQLGGISDVFTQSGTTFTSEKADGATLAIDGSGYYIYTAADGTRIQFDVQQASNTVYNCPGADPESCQVPLAITRPNGLVFTLTWRSALLCHDLPGEPCGEAFTYQRLQSVASSAGYSLAIAYASSNAGLYTEPTPAWYQRTGVTFSNSVTTPSPLPTISYAYPATDVVDVTDIGGRTWRLTTAGGRLSGIRRPGSASDDVTYSYGAAGTVSSATADGVTTNYSRTVSGSNATTTVTNALSQVSTVVSDLTVGRPVSATDPLSRTTEYQYDSNGRLKRVTRPEDDYVELTYDSRGNVTQTLAKAKPGTGTPDIVTSAVYPASCTNSKTCNQPTSTTDARGNTTDYTYDSNHGGLLTATGPAPTTGAVRPQARVTYGQVSSAGGQSVWMPTATSACQTLASCAGTADEVKTTTAYNSNLLPTSVSAGNGSGTLTATSLSTYDPVGNLLTVDGPIAGTADTIRYRYDSARQRVGLVSPDPDGAGALKPLAVRTTYRSDGQVSKVERGTVNSQSDADWAGFAPLEEVQTGFDANDRPSSQKRVAGSTIYALTQASYDALGRPDCVAQRMNPAIFATIATGACSLGTQGSGANDFGPDRISKTVYDAAGQVTQVKTAVGTALEAAEVTSTYTANGLVATVNDGENNLTTYEYDGQNRLAKTRFPSPTKGAGTSSTTDYEQLTYESLAGGTRTSGLVTAFRNRANQTIALSYDALGRLTLKDVPETGGDVAFTYDLRGLQLSALYSATGLGISSSYDALGRQTGSTTNLDGTGRTYGFQYDLAGRRTRVTHPDGPYFDYAYDPLGRMTTLKDNAAATLVTLAYDAAGNRDTATYANGVVTSYDFDAVGRLTSLIHNFAGTAQDVTFGYSYNPAFEIVSRTASNDLYAFAQANANVAATANGLNQLTTVAGGAATYDAKGNLLTEGGRTLTYDSENKLTAITTPQSTGLLYDPLGRFRAVTSTVTGAFDMVGTDIVGARVNGGATTERYAFGGVDEPMVGYDSAGIRTFFHADERGSIVARSDSAGSAAGRTLAYDDYGQPSAFSSRFLYAGKMLFGGINAYYNNARFYDYTLGRFLQPDPIGYGSGMNLYAYVKGDPVNFTDPLGLAQFEGCTGTRICHSDGSGSSQVFGDIRGYRGGGADGRDSSGHGGGSLSGGTGASNNGAFHGGPINGQTSCPNCIPGTDPRAQASIDYWGGYYQGNTWVSAGFGGGGATGSWGGGGFTGGGGGSFGGAGASGDWGCGCFEAGTLVSTPEGLRPIEKIDTGDLVLALNETTGVIAAKTVTDVIRPIARRLYAIQVRGANHSVEVFNATADHPWKVSGKGWVRTSDLHAGDSLVTAVGSTVAVAHVWATSKVSQTYNLTVADWHNFLVGKEGFIVHNVDCWQTEPSTLQEQMAMDAARAGAGSRIISSLDDPRYKGMEKWQYVVKSTQYTTTVHYVRDPVTGQILDVKVMSHPRKGSGN